MLLRILGPLAVHPDSKQESICKLQSRALHGTLRSLPVDPMACTRMGQHATLCARAPGHINKVKIFTVKIKCSMIAMTGHPFTETPGMGD